jgi:hypothetical protein
MGGLVKTRLYVHYVGQSSALEFSIGISGVLSLGEEHPGYGDNTLKVYDVR